MKVRSIFVLAAGAALAFSACSPAASKAPSVAPSAAASVGASAVPSAAASPSAAAAATVSLQLQWAPQAQFAGYFAADKQGYFAAENLTVKIIPGGPNVVPQAVGSLPNGPEFTISWVPKVLQAREKASDLVDIAQIFQRSGTLSVSWVGDKIRDPCMFAGKKVGVWDFGNEYEVTAAALNCGLTPGLEAGGDPKTQYQKVIQPFDMSLLLTKQIGVAEAMIYNEYAQLLEATNPDTGKLYTPAELNVINYNDFRTAMLQDAIFARQSWLDVPANRDIAVRFVRASLKGWIYCRDNPADCVTDTLAAGSQLGAGHQAWQMNEVNALIWPSPLGVGIVDPVFWSQTVKIAVKAGIIKSTPGLKAYDASIVADALKTMPDQDTTVVS